MKVLLYITCIILLAGCGGKKATKAVDALPPKQQVTGSDTAIKPAKFKPYKLIDGFMVTDTGYADAVVMGGTYAVVFKNGALLDTIEKGFGIQKIMDGMYFYQLVSSNGTLEDGRAPHSDASNAINASFDAYRILTNGKKQDLSTLAPDFSDYFSSPYIINNKIYYWQIKKIDTTGNNSISAAEYDPLTKKTISHYLFNDYIETDDSGYFGYPYLKNDTIYFDAGADKIKKISKDFKLYN